MGIWDPDWPQELTAKEVAERLDFWKGNFKFLGYTCKECGRTANLFTGQVGWFCRCGYYTYLMWSEGKDLFSNPDMGTPLNIILEGRKLSKRSKGIVGNRRSTLG